MGGTNFTIINRLLAAFIAGYKQNRYHTLTIKRQRRHRHCDGVTGDEQHSVAFGHGRYFDTLLRCGHDILEGVLLDSYIDVDTLELPGARVWSFVRHDWKMGLYLARLRFEQCIITGLVVAVCRTC